MYDDRFEDDDPYAGHTPWLQRPGVRAVVVVIAAGSFLLATLVSSCGPRHRISPPTTTTIPAVQVESPYPPPGAPIAHA